MYGGYHDGFEVLWNSACGILFVPHPISIYIYQHVLAIPVKTRSISSAGRTISLSPPFSKIAFTRLDKIV